jgi:16S rRNA (cytosine967-C5)-methyltransferase
LNGPPRPPSERHPGRGPASGIPGRTAGAEAQRQEALRHPGLAARLAAAAILRDIVVKGHSLDECFSPRAVLSRLGGLEARDIALVRSIVTVALRRLGTIRHALAALMESGLPRQIAQLEWTLVVAAAQILFLDIPDHAAVDLAVRAARLEPKALPYAALFNAVLRSLVRARDQILATSDPLDDDTPAWLAARWCKTYGETGARAIAAAHRREPTLDLTVLAEPSAWAERLDAVILPTGSLRLRTHDPVTSLVGYGDGAWLVQDAAAALPASLLHARPGMKIADLCAAPGGKAAQLAAAGAEVTAIDRSAERLKILAANFERLHLRAEIVVADVTTLDRAPFDAVLLDAPCLATGTIRRHPDIAWTKRQGDLAQLTSLQARMLDQAVTLTRPGGTIVYCTCSLEPEEGELQIAALLRRSPEVYRVPIEPAEVGGLAEILDANGDLRTLPSHLPSPDPRLAGLDGFFASRLARSKPGQASRSIP